MILDGHTWTLLTLFSSDIIDVVYGVLGLSMFSLDDSFMNKMFFQRVGRKLWVVLHGSRFSLIVGVPFSEISTGRCLTDRVRGFYLRKLWEFYVTAVMIRAHARDEIAQDLYSTRTGEHRK